ncbi:MAG: TlpA disulfide reductase family protein [Gammaproteobacteria bacterium]|nr:TlpA disulfide reductase family protein [Gammaproteobacteria bacterium]
MMVVVLVASCSAEVPPDFTDVEGQGHRYASFEDKWVIVNYWATWCAPCIKEIPELNTLAAEHADDLVVLGVNFDNPEGDEASKQAKKMKIEFPVYAHPPHEDLGITPPQVLPTTFVFAPGLDFVEKLVGPQTEQSLLAATDLAAESPP